MSVYTKILLATAAAACFVPALCHAEAGNLSEMTPGYSYYNRPGATAADHDAAVVACAAESMKVRSIDAQIHNSGLLGEALTDAANRGVFAAALENCMVVRGWRVVHLPEEEGRVLTVLSPDELAARLAPWVGADQPHGDVVRVWHNDAANASVKRYAIRPEHSNNGLLSLKAVTNSPLARIDLPNVPAVKVPKFDEKWPTRNLKPAQIATVTPDAGLIIINLKGLSMKNGIGLQLARIGADKDDSPGLTDHAPDAWNLMVGTLAAKKEGNILTVAAPPGRWRISGMGLMPMIGFCLGGPSFEVKAGEVIFMGTFDLGADDLGPDMSLEPAKAWLAGLPAADTVKPAVYTNGALGGCAYNNIYALEIKGAPYEPGYQWGGAAPAAPAAPAPAQ